MLILTAAQNTQPDYVALAMVLVLALIVAIMAIRKRFFTKAKEPEPVIAAPIPVNKPEKPAAPAAPAQEAAPTAAPAAAPAVTGAGEKVDSPMPGTILKVNVAAGQTVKEGDLLVVLEAMKMENEIFAPKGGTVSQVLVEKGASVNTGDVLVVIA